MIDPYDMVHYDRSRENLEELWMFCLAVAGKKATVVSQKLEEFLSGAREGESPFAYVRRLEAEGLLDARLREVKIGKYDILRRGFLAAAAPGAPDIATASVEELESLPGAGPKTARFFLLYSRRDAKVAVIDTHILKFLAMRGHKVPKGFPTNREYARLERLMIEEAEAAGIPMQEFDLAIWSHYASGGREPLPVTAEPVRIAA